MSEEWACAICGGPDCWTLECLHEDAGEGDEMKTDRELLGLAARAAGVDCVMTQPFIGLQIRDGNLWNPLTDDGDALRLAVSLKFQIIIYKDWVEILQDGIRVMNADSVYYAGCMIETTRRAIVRAAAAIGESMK